MTKPNDKHVQNILGKFGMEDANPGVLPGRKLELTSAGSMDPLTIEEKKICIMRRFKHLFEPGPGRLEICGERIGSTFACT